MTHGTHRDLRPPERVLARAQAAGLVMTRQRRELVALLFRGGPRHVTAKALRAEARAAGAQVARATVYNVLHSLTRAALIKEVRIEHGRTFYDTDMTPHYHLYFEDSGEIRSIPPDLEALQDLPRVLGIDRDRLDVLIRVRIRAAPTRGIRRGCRIRLLSTPPKMVKKE